MWAIVVALFIILMIPAIGIMTLPGFIKWCREKNRILKRSKYGYWGLLVVEIILYICTSK